MAVSSSAGEFSIEPQVLFFLKEEGGMRDLTVTGVQTCALPIWRAICQPLFHLLSGAGLPARHCCSRRCRMHRLWCGPTCGTGTWHQLACACWGRQSHRCGAADARLARPLCHSPCPLLWLACELNGWAAGVFYWKAGLILPTPLSATCYARASA